MATPSDNVSVVVIEMEPGWIYVKIAGAAPEPDRIEFFLRRGIEDWFRARPTLKLTKAEAIKDHGKMLGIHVWYDAEQVEPVPPSTPSPQSAANSRVFSIQVHYAIAGKHPREYVEAVVDDALQILPSYRDRQDALVVINPRRLAVILDKHTNRGKVLPADMVQSVLEGAALERLDHWLANPPTPFYVLHLAGKWFDGDAP